MTFDLFIDHAASDEPFVFGYLLPSLGLPDERVRLSSRLPVGARRVPELARCVENARVIVPVLSPAYGTQKWNQLTEQLAIHDNVGSDRLVPLILGPSNVPLPLHILVPLDFRDPSTWDQQVERLLDKLSTQKPPDRPIPCPYPGMRPFTPDDRAHFHGRDREVNELVERLRCGEREIYVVGPSGSGKSSLVATGVLPRLPDGTVVGSMRPGIDPLTRLREAVDQDANGSRTRGRVLFVDQLEELFTQSDPDQVRGFTAALRELRADERFALVGALRADFFGELITSDLWPDQDRKRCQVEIAPLRQDALRAAIEEPARAVGVHFEQRLVDRLVADAAAQPGALPLLQDVLVQLWARRLHRYIPLAAYEALGVDGQSGMAVMLGHRADAALHSLTREQQDAAQAIFLRLVKFGDGCPDTRRSRSRAELGGGGRSNGSLTATLERMVEGRLLTSDRRGPGNEVWYDLAHEALISAWPTLRHWIETGRADEVRRAAFEDKAAEWEREKRGPLDEVELREADEWRGRQSAHGLGLSDTFETFLGVSRQAEANRQRQRDEYRRIVGLKYQDQARQLVHDGRPLRALPCLVAAREAGQDSPPLRILFARALWNPVLASARHGAAVATARFSSDGARVVTASSDGSARVWEAETGAPITPPLQHEGPVVAACFSPDSTRVVTASHDRSARLWDARTGEPIGQPMLHHEGLTAITWSRDGTSLCTTSFDKTARVWDAASGAPVGPPLRHEAFVLAAAFNPDGTCVATASHDHSARVWTTLSGRPVTPPLQHTDVVRTVVFSPDGTRLLTASDDRTARLWDASSGELVTELVGHSLALRCAAFKPDGLHAVTASEDRTARVWDLSSGREIFASLEHRSTVRAASFSPDGADIVTAGEDGTTRLWRAGSGAPLCAPLEHERPVSAVTFSPDGRRVVTACRDGVARIWRAASEDLHGPALEHQGFVRVAAFNQDGSQIVTASDDETACLWESTTGKLLRRLSGHGGPVLSCGFSPDGATIVTAGADHTARLWRAATGRALKHPLEHQGSVRAAVFSPDGRRVVTASSDRTARVWDALSGRALTGPLVHKRGVVAAGFSPDGARVVTVSERSVLVWDVATARQLTPPLVHDGTVWSAVFSPDGQSIVTSCSDHTACLWDATSGRLRDRFVHRDIVRSAAFSPDGKRIVTASDDQSARVWDAVTGGPLTPLLEHGGTVIAAAFSSDSTLVVTASGDRTGRVWDATSGQPLLPPLMHRDQVVAASFSPDGARVVTASLDRTARIWLMPMHTGSLEEWTALADRHSAFTILDGILVPRREPASAILSATNVPAPRSRRKPLATLSDGDDSRPPAPQPRRGRRGARRGASNAAGPSPGRR